MRSIPFKHTGCSILSIVHWSLTVALLIQLLDNSELDLFWILLGCILLVACTSCACLFCLTVCYYCDSGRSRMGNISTILFISFTIGLIATVFPFILFLFYISVECPKFVYTFGLFDDWTIMLEQRDKVNNDPTFEYYPQAYTSGERSFLHESGDPALLSYQSKLLQTSVKYLYFVNGLPLLIEYIVLFTKFDYYCYDLTMILALAVGTIVLLYCIVLLRLK